TALHQTLATKHTVPKSSRPGGCSMSRTALLEQRGTDEPHLALAVLGDAIISLSDAADRGPQVLFAEARLLFRNLLPAKDVRLLVRSAGTWREWEKLNDGADEALIESLPDAPQDVVHVDGSVFIPVQIGCVGLLVEGISDRTALRELAPILTRV